MIQRVRLQRKRKSNMRTCTVRVGTELLNRMSQMSSDPSAFVLKHTAGLLCEGGSCDVRLSEVTPSCEV